MAANYAPNSPSAPAGAGNFSTFVTATGDNMTRMGTEPARFQLVGSPAYFPVAPATGLAPRSADARPEGEAPPLATGGLGDRSLSPLRDDLAIADGADDLRPLR